VNIISVICDSVKLNPSVCICYDVLMQAGSVVSTVLLFGNKMMISSFFVSCVLSFWASTSCLTSERLVPRCGSDLTSNFLPLAACL